MIDAVMCDRWAGKPSFAALKAGTPPNTLVIKAVAKLGRTGQRALDIGAGSLRNSCYLLDRGFTVDAVDVDPVAVDLAAQLANPRLRFIHDDITQVAIEPQSYSLVVAIHVMQYLSRADIVSMIGAIRSGLTDDGILCCTILGDRDGWADCRPLMTFLSAADCRELFRGFHILEFEEKEYSGFNVVGMPKHWHVFQCLMGNEHSDDREVIRIARRADRH
jgi:tellurite methyltransferase